jgi:hypothetical protein
MEYGQPGAAVLHATFAEVSNLYEIMPVGVRPRLSSLPFVLPIFLPRQVPGYLFPKTFAYAVPRNPGIMAAGNISNHLFAMDSLPGDGKIIYV